MNRVRNILFVVFILINVFCINVSATETTDAYDYNNTVNQNDFEQEQTTQENVITEGWKDTDSKTFYYKNGKKQTGWCKIHGKYYYFNKKGVLQKNKIVGDKKHGYYYVDSDGIRVTDKAIGYAVEFVMKNSNSKQSSEEKLKSCYRALCGYSYQRFYSNKPSAKQVKSYALYMFKNKKGNCYRYGSALAYIARVLGFDSRVTVGGVTAHTNTSLSPHGWCEVKIDGKWKICDCSMQRAHKNNNLFLVEKKNYPFRIRCDETYTMYVKKGKIVWK